MISNAQMIAMRNQNQQIDNLHILKSMLEMDDNVVPFLMRKQECDPKVVAAVVDKEMSRLPKVSGGEFYLGGGAQQALQKAILFCQDSGDEFVSLEHLLYGLLMAGDRVSQILKDAGMTEKGLKSAIQELHKGNKVNSANNEETYNALNKYARNL
ncbi:MAG: type VI secretion system ATPase TssH, partial [Bacteroidales bacterium]|nr:type VI secretion system ATPase TssH [Bacteroidales bacterium]